MDPSELAHVLELHARWDANQKGGVQADLRDADLRDVRSFCDANLDGVWISYRGNAVRIRFEPVRPEEVLAKHSERQPEVSDDVGNPS